MMARTKLRLVSCSFLLLVAAIASAQVRTSRWSAWQQTMAPDGSSYAAIQFRWRSNPPCTEIGCQLAVQIRNISPAPLRLRCWVYFDPPPTPHEDEVRPVAIDARLKSFGSHRTKRRIGDTTSPLIIPGVRITGVVVDSAKPK